MGAFFDLAWNRAVGLFGPLGPVYVIGALGLLLALAAAPLVFRRSRDPLSRLERLRKGRSERAEANPVTESLRIDRGKARFEALAPYLEPSDESRLSEVRAQLMRAGYKSPSAVRLYFMARAGIALGMVILALVAIAIPPGAPDPVWMGLGSALAGIVGYLLPSWRVTSRRRSRQGAIVEGFPDALDLMLVCVEAGQSLDQALVRVTTEIRESHRVLAEELGVVSSEMRAGKDRPQVLRDFADRTGVSDISAFVTVLVQSAAYGTSVSAALRVYAAEMRDKRLVRAEEKANTLPTKLTLGTMFFTVPPLMLILIGPSLIDILRALTNLNAR